MKDWLKNEFYSLVTHYADDESLVYKLWMELENQYEQKFRYYHNFSHIYNMLIQSEEFASEIKDYQVLKFAIWYHDVIYKSTKQDNEEKSASFAKNRLNSLHFEAKRTETVKNLIISTKKHELILHNNDNEILLDLDLSILGTDWESYKKYFQNIRREYAMYPNFMYKSGRKKVLQHFLERRTLYFTEFYRNKFESKARQNLKKEIELL